MIRVIIESPYAGEVNRNIAYARACVRDSIYRGEAPIASHLLYTQPGILDDEFSEERELGIKAGLAWGCVAEKHVFYCDFGMSEGMKAGLAKAEENGTPVEFRRLYKDDIISAGLGYEFKGFSGHIPSMSVPAIVMKPEALKALVVSPDRLTIEDIEGILEKLKEEPIRGPERIPFEPPPIPIINLKEVAHDYPSGQESRRERRKQERKNKN